MIITRPLAVLRVHDFPTDSHRLIGAAASALYWGSSVGPHSGPIAGALLLCQPGEWTDWTLLKMDTWFCSATRRRDFAAGKERQS